MTQTTTPPRRGMTEQAAGIAIDQACRMLRLPSASIFRRAGLGRCDGLRITVLV